jgi:hypothetical protein
MKKLILSFLISLISISAGAEALWAIAGGKGKGIVEDVKTVVRNIFTANAEQKGLLYFDDLVSRGQRVHPTHFARQGGGAHLIKNNSPNVELETVVIRPNGETVKAEINMGSTVDHDVEAKHRPRVETNESGELTTVIREFGNDLRYDDSVMVELVNGKPTVVTQSIYRKVGAKEFSAIKVDDYTIKIEFYVGGRLIREETIKSKNKIINFKANRHGDGVGVYTEGEYTNYDLAQGVKNLGSSPATSWNSVKSFDRVEGRQVATQRIQRGSK